MRLQRNAVATVAMMWLTLATSGCRSVPAPALRPRSTSIRAITRPQFSTARGVSNPRLFLAVIGLVGGAAIGIKADQGFNIAAAGAALGSGLGAALPRWDCRRGISYRLGVGLSAAVLSAAPAVLVYSDNQVAGAALLTLPPIVSSLTVEDRCQSKR